MKLRFLIIFISIIFVGISFARTTVSSDCKYKRTQLLKVNKANETSCKEVKLCFADISCDETSYPGGKKIRVNRNSVCAVDASGKCPSVEACQADTAAATIESEAQLGSAGPTDWSTVLVESTPGIVEAALRAQSSLSSEPALDRTNNIEEAKVKKTDGRK